MLGKKEAGGVFEGWGGGGGCGVETPMHAMTTMQNWTILTFCFFISLSGFFVIAGQEKLGARLCCVPIVYLK